MDANAVVASLNEAVQYARGELKLTPVTVSVPHVDVKVLRETMGLSQVDFAGAFLLSLPTVQGWEQGRREPDGPARTLLALIQRDPEFVKRQLAEMKAA